MEVKFTVNDLYIYCIFRFFLTMYVCGSVKQSYPAFDSTLGRQRPVALQWSFGTVCRIDMMEGRWTNGTSGMYSVSEVCSCQISQLLMTNLSLHSHKGSLSYPVTNALSLSFPTPFPSFFTSSHLFPCSFNLPLLGPSPPSKSTISVSWSSPYLSLSTFWLELHCHRIKRHTCRWKWAELWQL